MSFRFLDGTPVTSDAMPPLTPDERINFLEQRVADLETVIKALADGQTTPAAILEALRAT